MQEAIALAKERAAEEKVPNAHYVEHDAATLKDDAKWAGYFDYITAFDSIHDQSFPDKALEGDQHAINPSFCFLYCWLLMFRYTIRNLQGAQARWSFLDG